MSDLEKNLYRDGLPLIQYEHQTPQPRGIWPGNTVMKVLRNIFVPTFFRAGKKSDRRPNAGLMALDGLRGLACLAVVNQHYSSTFTNRIYLYGWGTYAEDRNIVQFPFVKILWAGSAQVFTFFVLSGYVLSYKPIKQMQSHSPLVLKTLSSSIFRRGMRLFIPAFTMVTIVAVVTQVGIYKRAQKIAEQGFMSHLEAIPQQQESIWIMLTCIYNDFATMMNITNWGYVQPALNPHLWTIIIEFRVSMLLYLVQTGTARLRSWARILIGGYAFFWFSNTLSPVGSQTALFFAGMMLAEVDVALVHLHDEHDMLPTDSKVAWESLRRSRMSIAARVARLTHPRSIHWRGFHLVLFLLGLFFLSCSYNHAEDTPVYGTLIAWLEPSWYKALEHSYWLWTVGACCLLSSAMHSRDIQWIYNNAFSQYAGRVSFALYLSHGPVLRCVEYNLLPFLAAVTEPLGGRNTNLGFVLQWFMGVAVCIPTVFYFADMLYRLLDVPSVQLARWCEAKLEDSYWQSSSPTRSKP